MILGGHTDSDGPNKEVELIDLSMECYKTKAGKAITLPDDSDGGKTYFPPLFDPQTGKLHIVFGYCDEAPFLEDIPFSDFLTFNGV